MLFFTFFSTFQPIKLQEKIDSSGILVGSGLSSYATVQDAAKVLVMLRHR